MKVLLHVTGPGTQRVVTVDPDADMIIYRDRAVRKGLLHGVVFLDNVRIDAVELRLDSRYAVIRLDDSTFVDLHVVTVRHSDRILLAAVKCMLCGGHIAWVDSDLAVRLPSPYVPRCVRKTVHDVVLQC